MRDFCVFGKKKNPMGMILFIMIKRVNGGERHYTQINV